MHHFYPSRRSGTGAGVGLGDRGQVMHCFWPAADPGPLDFAHEVITAGQSGRSEVWNADCLTLYVSECSFGNDYCQRRNVSENKSYYCCLSLPVPHLTRPGQSGGSNTDTHNHRKKGRREGGGVRNGLWNWVGKRDLLGGVDCFGMFRGMVDVLRYFVYF